jgi:hypothetical protein
MRGSFEYSEYVVVDSRQWVVLQLSVLGGKLITPQRRKPVCYEMLRRISDVDGFFGTEQSNGNWNSFRNAIVDT